MNKSAVVAFADKWEIAMPPKTSRDLRGPGPKQDKDRDQQNAVIKDAENNDGWDRDQVHGDGNDLGLDKNSR